MRIDNWPFFLAFSCFRMAAITQGVYARGLQGNAADPRAIRTAESRRRFAATGWQMAQRIGCTRVIDQGVAADEQVFTMSAQLKSDDQLEAFRRDTRAWLEANCPAEMRQPVAEDGDVCWGGRRWKFKSDAQRVWLEKMAERGWTVPEWPKAIRRRRTEQGRGARAARRNGAAQVPSAAHVHSASRCSARRCSSTATSSRSRSTCRRSCAARSAGARAIPSPARDRTSLRSRRAPTIKGDHFLVNGSKIWTSYGDKADWIFCLVRTDFTAKKQEGISFLLFDMESPGISTRPIRLISGYSPFTQTFFDNVKVPKENLVGELNKGWTIAKYLLTHERNMIGGMGTQRHDAAQPACDQEHRARVGPPRRAGCCAPISRASRWMRRRSR